VHWDRGLSLRKSVRLLTLIQPSVIHGPVTNKRLPEDELRAALGRLVASELVFQRGTPPAAVYAFKHALVQTQLTAACCASLGSSCTRRSPRRWKPIRLRSWTASRSAVCHSERGVVLSHHRAAFSEDGEVECAGEPVHYRAQPFKLRASFTGLGAQHNKFAGGVQFEEARPLLA
jgi:hypothetical protein